MTPCDTRPVAAVARARLAALLASLALAACATPQKPARAPDSRAARLTIEAPSGATVQVDGVRVGVAPLGEPLELEPGSHSVVLTSTGHLPRRTEVSLARGESRSLTVELESTSQRKVSWVLLGTGAAALTTGIVFGVLSVVEQRQARDVQGRDDELSGSQQQAYDDAIGARDDYRIGSGTAAAASLGLFLVGGALFVLDQPDVGEQDEVGSHKTHRASLQVQPMVSPTGAGSSLTLRF